METCIFVNFHGYARVRGNPLGIVQNQILNNLINWDDAPTLSSPTSQHWPFLTTGLSSTMPSLYGNWVSVERKWCIASRGFNKPEDRRTSKRETNRQIAKNCGLGKSSFANIAGTQGIPRFWPCGNCLERIDIG